MFHTGPIDPETHDLVGWGVVAAVVFMLLMFALAAYVEGTVPVAWR